MASRKSVTMSAWLDSWDSLYQGGGLQHGHARRLGCSRAQVSRQIGQLEAEAGRAPVRALHPSPAAHAGRRGVLSRRAGRRGGGGLAAQRALSHLGSAPRGLLRISATMTLAVNISPAAADADRTPLRAGMRADPHRPDGGFGGRPHRPGAAANANPAGRRGGQAALADGAGDGAAPDYLARHGTPEHLCSWPSISVSAIC